MRRANLNDLQAFLVVARAHSFTRAAALLGVSQSALSQTLRALEERLGVRLLARTTRSVTATEAGERLLRTLGPAIDEIGIELASLMELRDKPAGNIRLTSLEHAADTLIIPALTRLLPDYPDIKVEVVIDYGLTDIVSERFDAGVRIGELVARDMIAVRIGPDMRMTVVGAPSYFEAHPLPTTPDDLARHRCINLRLPTLGGLYAWEFAKGKRERKVRVDGQLTFNNTPLMLESAMRGLGLAYVLDEERVAELVVAGKLVRVLVDWCPALSGYHLYYPNRRQPSAAFSLLVEALRYRK